MAGTSPAMTEMGDRSRDASAPEVCKRRWRIDLRSSPRKRGPSLASRWRGNERLMFRYSPSTTTKRKESGTPTNVFGNLRILRCGARASGTRSPVGVPPRLTPSGLAPVRRQLQARLPGTRQDVRSDTVAPTGERRPRAVTRSLAAPACPSPGNAPPGPVIVPANMMPEAARMRSVSFRARAPHSLHPQEYPRPKASFTERDSLQRSGKRDACQEKQDGH